MRSRLHFRLETGRGLALAYTTGTGRVKCYSRMAGVVQPLV